MWGRSGRAHVGGQEPHDQIAVLDGGYAGAS